MAEYGAEMDDMFADLGLGDGNLDGAQTYPVSMH